MYKTTIVLTKIEFNYENVNNKFKVNLIFKVLLYWIKNKLEGEERNIYTISMLGDNKTINNVHIAYSAATTVVFYYN